MSQEIYDDANRLERAIRALPEYQKVLEVKETIQADAMLANCLMSLSLCKKKSKR